MREWETRLIKKEGAKQMRMQKWEVKGNGDKKDEREKKVRGRIM